MQPNGQLNMRIRQLMPYAIITCEILTNDYYLHNFIQCQFKLAENKGVNKNNLKENFYNILPKELKSNQVDEMQVEENNKNQKETEITNNGKKEVKIIVNFGDIKLCKSSSSSTTKRDSDCLLDHMDKLNENLNQKDVNLLGLPVIKDNKQNEKTSERKLSKIPKIGLNCLKKVPLIEAATALAVDKISRFKKIPSDQANNLPNHDLVTHTILEKFSCRLNSYKVNSHFANELNINLSNISYMSSILTKKENKLARSIRKMKNYLLKSTTLCIPL